MLRSLIGFVGAFLLIGGGNVATILLVKRLDAPLLVFPAVIVIILATAALFWATSPPGLSPEEKLRRLTQ